MSEMANLWSNEYIILRKSFNMPHSQNREMQKEFSHPQSFDTQSNKLFYFIIAFVYSINKSGNNLFKN